MNNKKSTPPIVKFAIFTVITTFVWIGFDVYRAFTRSTPPDIPEEVLRPLDPTIDEGVLGRITETVYLEDTEIGDTDLINPEVLTPVEEAEEVPKETSEPTEAAVEETNEVIEN